MLDDQQFDSVVAGFYNAATGASSWDEALAPVQQAFDAHLAVLHTLDVNTGRLIQLHHGGAAAHAGALDYVRHWHERDPRRAHVIAHPEKIAGRLWQCCENFDDRFVAHNEFFRHFLAAQGSRYEVITASLPSPTVMTAFTLELPAQRGPLTADECHMVERLSRHIAEALRAYERVRLMASLALAGHGLLDAFTYPMWLLDADRFVFHCNPAAQALVAEGEAFETAGRRLVCKAARPDRNLGLLLHSLSHGRHGVRAIVDARLRGSDPPTWLHLHALAPSRVLGAFGDRPMVLATLFDPRAMRELDPFALSDVFGLTPTEGRVAVLLAEGLTAQVIATRLGCSVNTVRTHLRRVLAKLGATRIADAVRLLRQGEALWSQPDSTMWRT